MSTTIDSDAAPDPVGPEPRKPACKLVGEDGNVFNVIGRVKRALKDAGQPDRAREFVQRAFGAQSYDEVLGLCHEYVDVR
jgi:hypothetical protein